MSGGLYLPFQQSLWTFPHIGADGWHPWQKPTGATSITLIGVGGAGGGGGGNTGAAASLRGGGGGGGSAAQSRLVIPAYYLPDVLYIRPGAGGLGGAATVGGSVGTVTMIAAQPTTTASPSLLYLVANNGTGANPGSSNGAGGAGGAASTGVECMFSGWGNFTSTAGQNGTAGGASTGAAGTALNSYGSLGIPFSSGTGGGGTGVANTDFAGGAITAIGLVPQIAGGVAAAGPGSSGLTLGPPWQYTGGTGGGTAGPSGTAGKGGEGAPGCGGGGGGGGVTGGAGGKGGDGMVWIIVSF